MELSQSLDAIICSVTHILRILQNSWHIPFYQGFQSQKHFVYKLLLKHADNIAWYNVKMQPYSVFPIGTGFNREQDVMGVTGHVSGRTLE
jgi:hypothetical protein